MSLDKKFSVRWQELALHETLQLRPEATITAHTLRDPGSGDQGLEQTIAAQDGPDAPLTESTTFPPRNSLPRISLGPRSAEASDGPRQHEQPDLTLTRLLGEGGMGRVHLAQQRSLGREVAVKTLKNKAEASRQALISEARVTSYLAHPGIIPVHSLGLDGSDEPVLVMKRIEGVPWRDLIHDPNNAAWAFWDSRTEDRLLTHLEILSHVCDAVHFAHSQGVIHRDIKPENVMLGTFGEVYLVDWGLAHRATENATGQLVGTPAYMAPEMVMGEAVDVRTDVYLLGATLHEILTGTSRHRGSDLQMLFLAAAKSEPAIFAPEVPAGLAALCNQATAQDPAERPPTAEDFRRAISNFLSRRTSITLCDAANERLEQIPTGNDAIPPQELAFQIATLAAEARFGYEQALEAWPDNPAAETGRQRCLGLLVEGHLMRRDPFGARAQLEAMRDPPIGLTEMLRQLGDELAQEQAEEVRLKRMDAELDEAIGESARALAYLVLCVMVVSISAFLLLTGRATDIDHGTSVVIALVVFVTAILVLAYGRKQLLSNAFNRRCVAMVFIMIGLIVANRLLSWQLGTPFQQMFTMDLLLMTACTGAAAVNLMPWMRWMSVCFLLGAGVTASVASALAPTSFALTALLSLAVGFVTWRRMKSKHA